jgi:hypothetical protein
LLHFSGVREIGAHAPPDPSQSAGQIELFSELSNNFSVAVCLQERCRKRNPAPSRNDSHHIEQEDEQIVRLSGSSRERFLMGDFKVNQSRAIVARIVDNILRSTVAV